MASVRTDNVQIKLDIDGSQSKTELDNLTRRAQVLKQDLKEMKRGTDEYVAASKELRQVNARVEELHKELGTAGLSMSQLQNRSRQLNRELRDLTPGTEAFISKSRQLAEVDTRLEAVRQDVRGIRDELNNSGGGFADFVKKSAAFAGIQIGVQEVVSGLKQLGSESIDAAKEGSDSIADMEKSLNLTTAEAKALRGELEGIDTRTSQENLEGIAVAAGQLGIAGDEAVEFTQAVDQAVVALGDEFTGGVEDVTKSLGGLQKLFKQTRDESPADALTKIGSAVNALGADGMASGPVIAEFTSRIGQLGDLAPQITQTLGLGAAFQELGLSAEISSGGVTNVLLTASKETEKFSRQIGLTDQEFRKLLNSDPNEVLLRLADSLRGASNTEIVSTLDQLGIKSQEATKVVSLLANQTDFVRQKQALASAEFEKATSLTDEFAKKNTNAAAEVEKSEKAFARYRRELGEQLIPIYIKALNFAGLVLDVLRATPQFVSENRAAFTLLALAVLSWNGALVKAQLATIKDLALRKLLALELATETAGTITLKSAKDLLTASQNRLNAAMLANPLGVVLVVLGLVAFALKELYERSETFRVGVDSLFTMLKVTTTPLLNMFRQLLASVAPLAQRFSEWFGQLGIGKTILEAIGQVVKLNVVVPFQLLVLQVTAVINTLDGLLDVGKRVLNLFGANFKVDPNGSFNKLAENFKRNAQAIKDSFTGQDLVKAQQKAGQERVQAYEKELLAKMRAQAEADNKQKAAEKQAGADRAAQQKEIDHAANIERLKMQQAALEQRLAKAAEGSTEELKLKKQLVLVARDIELEDEKKTAGDRAIIRAKAQIELDKLNREFAKKQAEQAKKDAEEARKRAEEEAQAAADIEKRKAALIKDEYLRRAAELRAAAAAEATKLKGTEAQVAEQRRLINEKLNRDLEALAKERADKEAEQLRRIEQAEADTAVRRATRAREAAEARLGPLDDGAAAEQERVARLAALELQLDDELSNEQLTANEKLAIIRQFNEEKAALNDEYAERDKQRNQEGVAFFVQASQLAVQSLADFEKISSDKELARLDKDKKTRLKSLENEYKTGKLSKEEYEKQKAGIEESYDQRVRSVKRAAAQEEKKWAVAQSIMLGVLSVLRATSIPEKILNGIAAALATAKIVATPIPEFAQGGLLKSTWRGAKAGVGAAYRSMRKYAHGGRITELGGVPEGPRHGSGGIQLYDGATGQHLGEMEGGEPIMILSRATYANNRELVDELLDTSLYRGGARVRPRQGVYAEDGAMLGELPAPAARPGGQAEVVAAIDRQTAVLEEGFARRSVAVIDWGQEDDAYLESRLDERAAVRREATG